MTFKQLCFQLHWFLGITAGTVLVVMGLSGALMSFQHELIDWLNPGVVQEAPGSARAPERAALGPAELLAAMRAHGETRRIERIEMHAGPGQHPRITFAPEDGAPHGASTWANAYTGELPAHVTGADFFAWVEHLHIWLLLPTHIGQPVTGVLAACLLVLSLSGLYLRWPRTPWSLKTWLHLHLRRKGRPLLWELHSVIGTWALLVYLVLAGTGMYWGLAPLRAWVDGWAGVPARAPRAATPAALTPPRQPAPLAHDALRQPWQSFERAAGAWQFVQVRVPRTAGQDVQFNWYGRDAAHEMARHRMSVAADGRVRRDERFESLPPARQALAAIYPLHMGSYFGLPGRLAAMLAALAMPLFAVTGWLLYLDRRRKSRRLAESSARHGATDPQGAQGPATVAVIHASQSGNAHHLAGRTAARLRASGHAVDVLGAAQVSAQVLGRYAHTLWVASTFGEGEAPDTARGLLRALPAMAQPNHGYAVLALGDRQYAQFCAFGLGLHGALAQTGAAPLFAPVTMDGDCEASWQRWCAALGAHWALQAPEPHAQDEADAFAPYRLIARVHCNPGSLGAPIYKLTLQPPPGQAVAWQAGALVEVVPCHAPEAVQSLLAAARCAGDEAVHCHGQTMSLRQALTTSQWPPSHLVGAGLEALVAALRPIAPRRYSIASLPQSGVIELWVRLAQHEGGGVGLASDWLTRVLALGDTVPLRLRSNPHFAPSRLPGQRAILIGNGSGYAGLRAQLLARMQAAQYDSWLIFGERQRQADGWAQQEARAWQAAGQLRRADFAYSRDTDDAGVVGGARHVQDIVRQHRDAIRRWILQGAVVYVCGSRDGMAAGVEQALVALLGDAEFERFCSAGRYLRDVY